MKGQTGRARINWPAPAQAEQRLLAGKSARERRLTLPQMPCKQCSELGTKGHETTLVELRLSNYEQLSIKIDILDLQPTSFPDAQSQAVQNREENEVGGAALSRSAFAGECLGEREQSLGLRDVEYEGRTLISAAPWRRLQWCPSELPVIDQVRKQSAQRAAQMIVASWTWPRT